MSCGLTDECRLLLPAFVSEDELLALEIGATGLKEEEGLLMLPFEAPDERVFEI